MKHITLLLLALSSLFSLLAADAVASTLTLAEKQLSVEQTLDVFQQHYVYPARAEQATLRLQHLRTSEFLDAFSTYESLAKGLSQALRDETGDNHMDVIARSQSEVTHILEPQQNNRKYNHAFEQVSILADNIGYVKFNKFSPADEAFAVADLAMGFVRDARALIVDLRDNQGGSPLLSNYLLSHFLPTGTPVWNVVDRHSQVINEWVVDETPFKFAVPVVILTSHKTGSAAELFTYVLKHAKGVRTVGQKTYGIAHLVGAREINARLFGRFSLSRIEVATTGTDWEQKGIVPDIEVEPEHALSRALKLLNAE